MKVLLILLALTSNAMADDFWTRLQEIQKDPTKAFTTPAKPKRQCHDEDVFENGKWHTITVCK